MRTDRAPLLAARSRRGAIGALLAAFLLPAAAAAQAPSPAFSDILVDIRPLRDKGLGPYADAVGTALRRELLTAFADRRGRGPRLVVRVDGVSLRSYAGPGAERGGGLSSSVQNDYMEGEALVVAPNGGVLARYPQLSALPASSGGAWYLPDAEARRVDALSQHFAGWFRRRID